MRDEEPLELDAAAGGLAGARSALAPPRQRPLPIWIALACAGLMALAAIAVAGVVLLGGWEPGVRPATASVRAPLTR